MELFAFPGFAYVKSAFSREPEREQPDRNKTKSMAIHAGVFFIILHLFPYVKAGKIPYPP